MKLICGAGDICHEPAQSLLFLLDTSKLLSNEKLQT